MNATRRVRLLIIALGAVICSAAAWAEDDILNSGLIVASISNGRAYADGRMMAGDKLLRWRRLDANVDGELITPIDLLKAQFDEAPLGQVELLREREGNREWVFPEIECWCLQVRPPGSGPAWAEYDTLLDPFESGDITPIIDVIDRVVAQTQVPQSRVWLLSNAAAWTLANDKVVSQSFVELAATEAERQDDKYVAAIVYLLQAKRLSRRSQFEDALSAHNAAQAIWESMETSSLFLAHSYEHAGRASLRLGDSDAAKRLFERSLDIRRDRAPKSLAVVESLMALSSLKTTLGDVDQAEQLLTEALATTEAIAPKGLTIVRVLVGLGSATMKRQDFLAARGYFSKADDAGRGIITGTANEAAVVNNLGVVSYELGEYEAAKGYYLRTLALVEKTKPRSRQVAGIHGNLGVLALQQGRLDEAQAELEKTLEIESAISPASLDVARSYNNLGIVAREKGDLRAESVYQQKALNINLATAPAGLGVADNLANLGSNAMARGKLQEAETYYLRAHEVRHRISPEGARTAKSYQDLGTVALSRHNFDVATEHFEHALQLHRKQSQKNVDIAAALSSLGSVAALSGDHATAIDYYASALEMVRELAPDSYRESALLAKLGKLAMGNDDLVLAGRHFDAALELRQKSAPDSVVVAESLADLGALNLRRGQLIPAEEALQRARVIFQRLAPGSLAGAEVSSKLAGIFQDKGNTKSALEMYAAALEDLESFTGSYGGVQEDRAELRARNQKIYRQYIHALVDAGQVSKAFHVLERSRARGLVELLAERELDFDADLSIEVELERRKAAVQSDQILAKLADETASLDEQQIDELLQQLATLRRSQSELRERIRRESPAFATLTYPDALDANMARATLEPGTLMLAYSVGDDDTLVFALTQGDDPMAFKVERSGGELRNDIEAFRTALQAGSAANAEAVQSPAARLSESLLEPVAPLLESAERVLIVADGPLHVLPFSTLPPPSIASSDQAAPSFLLEWRPVHFVASATTYALLKKRQSKSRTAYDSVVAFGDPDVGAFDTDEMATAFRTGSSSDFVRARRLLPRLPDSRAEVNFIASHFGDGAKVYIGGEATEQRVKSLSAVPNVLHFATHALVDERFPLDSAIVLSASQDSLSQGQNGLLQAWEVFEQLRMPVDLVTLSACETALGQELAGEGILGLTRAFQYAGARTVLASLWRVPDRSTAQLMNHFYAHLKSGLDKDEALQQAQIDMLRSNFVGEADNSRGIGGLATQGQTDNQTVPLHWAAFVLIGDRR